MKRTPTPAASARSGCVKPIRFLAARNAAPSVLAEVIVVMAGHLHISRSGNYDRFGYQVQDKFPVREDNCRPGQVLAKYFPIGKLNLSKS
jgi:hypothetical protein